MSHACNKCGTPVPPSDDVTILDAALTGNPLIALFAISRHILPVVIDGTLICEGSPSRAQYLEGQPRDTRGYDYIEANEAPTRAAYAAMQLDFSSAPSPS